MTSELAHHYGSNIHIVSHLYLSSLLADLSRPECHQPKINHLIHFLYSQMLGLVVSKEFPEESVLWATRMTESHPECRLNAQIISQKQKVVVVNLARAGTLPSHICYETLNYLLPPSNVRQDHIMAARQVDERQQVIGSQFGASKIGGDINDVILLFPDPMGATGSTLVAAVDHYKRSVQGKPKKFIALHLIITPEYLRNIQKSCPELQVYALRLDRGLSQPQVLKSVPGTYWEQERGLNEKDYIVPGAGGLGEILNNSYV